MSIFDNIGKAISDVSQSTIQKGKDLANVAKYNRLISEEEKEASKIFEKLGRKYFEIHGSDFEPDFADCIEEISASNDKIKGFQEIIKELQGITKCDNCGADIPSGAMFCPECGNKAKADDEAEALEQDPDKIYCSECGSEIIPGAKFCTVCGTKYEPVPDEETEADDDPLMNGSEEAEDSLEEAVKEEKTSRRSRIRKSDD